jgi:hypothetical protein
VENVDFLKQGHPQGGGKNPPLKIMDSTHRILEEFIMGMRKGKDQIHHFIPKEKDWLQNIISSSPMVQNLPVYCPLGDDNWKLRIGATKIGKWITNINSVQYSLMEHPKEIQGK